MLICFLETGHTHAQGVYTSHKKYDGRVAFCVRMMDDGANPQSDDDSCLIDCYGTQIALSRIQSLSKQQRSCLTYVGTEGDATCGGGQEEMVVRRRCCGDRRAANLMTIISTAVRNDLDA